MRTIFAAAALAALAACGPAAGPAEGNDSANAAAAPAANAASPAAELAEWRAAVLEGCIGGGRDRVRDPNVPVEQHCACAIDRLAAGKTLAQLREEELTGAHAENFRTFHRQCIAEISPDYPLRPAN